MDRYIIYNGDEKLGENLTFEALQYIVEGLLDNHNENDEIMTIKIGKMNHWYSYKENETPLETPQNEGETPHSVLEPVIRRCWSCKHFKYNLFNEGKCDLTDRHSIGVDDIACQYFDERVYSISTQG